MSKIVTSDHGECPDCGGSGCLTTWDNGNTYCHQCSKTTLGSSGSSSYSDPPDAGLDVEYRAYRGLKQETVEFFDILTSLDAEGNEVSRLYAYPHKTRVRILPKDFTKNKGFTNDHLFGMDKFNAGSSRVLTIVEGEDDVPAAYEMLGSKWPVVCIPGVSSVSGILKNKECYDYISAFESIVIATDSDDPGEQAATKLAATFPGRCYRVNMTTYNDPMEYHNAGKSSDFLYAWVNRKKYVPDNVFNTPDQFSKILKDGVGYTLLPTNIKQFDGVTGGLAQGAFTVLQAPEGIGKTELMRYLEYNLIKNYPTVPFATMHLEESKKRGLLGLASYSLDQDVTMQDSEFIEKDGDLVQVFLDSYNGVPEDTVESAIREWSSKENFYQFSMGMSESPDFMIDQIRYFSEVCGCKYVFFEPIQDLAYSNDDGREVEPWLRDFSTKLGRIAAELNVGIVTIAHENDDGQIRDCRMIGKRAHVVVRLERDQQSTDLEVKNTTKLTVLKNRPTAATGFGGEVFFNRDTFTIKEKEY